MSRAAANWLGAVVLALLVTGVIFAVAQPGGLSDDDEPVATATTTPEPTVTTPTTTAPPTTGPTTGGNGTGAPDDGSGAPDDGSGLGTGGAGTADPDELVNSGGEALVVPGLLLAALGLAATARRRQNP